MRLKHWLFAAAALSACPLAGHAQTSPTRVTPQNRPDQNPPVIRDRQRAGPQVPHAQATAVKVTPFVLRSVTIQGSTLPAGELEAAWRPFVGQTLDTQAILKLTDALAAVYERDDIAIYTVTVQNQTFADGVLRIKALEGHVEGVTINGPTGRRNRALIQRYADKLTAERPLRRSTLQRYVSLIRDIPGLASQLDLVNGTTEDGVRMNLKLTPHPVQVALSVNNRGTAFLGRTQVEGDLYLNSLLTQGDQAKLSIAAPTDTNLFQSYAGQYQTPIGSDGLTLTVNASYLRTHPKDTDLLGHATAAGVQLSFPIQRSYHQDIYATLGVDGVDNDNAFLGFTFANDRTRAVRAAISYSHQSDRQLFFGSATFSQGIDGLGARVTDPDISQADFRKLNAKGGANFAIGKNSALRFTAAGQWTGDRLPATEQFALGGEEFGRAYEASVVAGDYGAAGSAEYAYRFPKLPAPIQGSEAFTYVDGGQVWYKERLGSPTTSARIASAGVGVRVRLQNKAIVQLEADNALENPSPFLKEQGWRGIFTIKTLF